MKIQYMRGKGVNREGHYYRRGKAPNAAFNGPDSKYNNALKTFVPLVTE